MTWRSCLQHPPSFRQLGAGAVAVAGVGAGAGVGASVGGVLAMHVFHCSLAFFAQSHAAFPRHFLAPVISGQLAAGGGAAAEGLTQVLNFASLLTRLNSHPR